jgi:ubiquinol-cytochrome c reductase cytochrome c1 subunit
MRINLSAVIGVAFFALAGVASASEEGHASWQREAGNQITNVASLQRGARNFMQYCSGCHSLKYMRYSRLASDLNISDSLRDTLLVKPGDKFSDYIKTSMPEKDAVEWFGKVPPDLSLIARARGTDYLFNFLTTFYADPTNLKTGVNNLQLPTTAMPHVLASLQGVQTAEWKTVETKGEDGKAVPTREFEKFAAGVTGSLTPAQYDEFVRDTVNFLQYVGDPSQVERQSLGVWVVLFLLLFTGISYMLKKEYWKDVR